MKKKLISAGITVLIVVLLIEISGNNHLYKAVYYNFSRIDNPEIFHNRVVKKGPQSQKHLFSKSYTKALPVELEKELVDLETVSFLMLKDDSIVFERYFGAHNDSVKTNSFSMAKSIVSMLIGAAIKEGKIESVKDPIAKYIPSFLENGKEKITIEHVLWMSSGLSWYEHYVNPFSDATKAYYGTDLLGQINRRKVERSSGKIHEYLSGDTQILSLLLSRAVRKSVSEYTSEQLWEPLGMESDALWSLDGLNGEEKGYCCLHSTARDFAKLGQLWLHKGNWKGIQIVDTAYVEASITPCLLEDAEKLNSKVDYYGYQWWLHQHNGKEVFYMRGIHGQFVLCYPEKNTVIVRLGHKRGKPCGNTFQEVVNMLNFADQF